VSKRDKAPQWLRVCRQLDDYCCKLIQECMSKWQDKRDVLTAVLLRIYAAYHTMILLHTFPFEIRSLMRVVIEGTINTLWLMSDDAKFEERASLFRGAFAIECQVLVDRIKRLGHVDLARQTLTALDAWEEFGGVRFQDVYDNEKLRREKAGLPPLDRDRTNWSGIGIIDRVKAIKKSKLSKCVDEVVDERVLIQYAVASSYLHASARSCKEFNLTGKAGGPIATINDAARRSDYIGDLLYSARWLWTVCSCINQYYDVGDSIVLQTVSSSISTTVMSTRHRFFDYLKEEYGIDI
jgi:hypothetical protein